MEPRSTWRDELCPWVAHPGRTATAALVGLTLTALAVLPFWGPAGDPVSDLSLAGSAIALAVATVVTTIGLGRVWALPVVVVPFAAGVLPPLRADDALWAIAWVMFTGGGAVVAGVAFAVVVLLRGRGTSPGPGALEGR
ncbi:hypothetical protein [Kineococcus sp. NPDC059986]|uniref:hypothetical protein n=1 Tax=Kineococcus sp. NPDC059986 TaxID=3155538 RepID=UPI00344FB9EA